MNMNDLNDPCYVLQKVKLCEAAHCFRRPPVLTLPRGPRFPVIAGPAWTVGSFTTALTTRYRTPVGFVTDSGRKLSCLLTYLHLIRGNRVFHLRDAS